MKIAMLTNNYKPFVGGVPISVERQAQELVKRGHQVTVFAPEYEILDDETKKMKIHSGTEYDNGIRIIRFRTGKRCMENGMVYPRVILKEITQVFAEEHFDLIHTHHPMFVGPTALYLGRKYQLPVIYTYHTRYEDYLHYLDFLQENQSFPNLRKWMLKKGRETIKVDAEKRERNDCSKIYALVYQSVRFDFSSDSGDAETDPGKWNKSFDCGISNRAGDLFLSGISKRGRGNQEAVSSKWWTFILYNGKTGRRKESSFFVTGNYMFKRKNAGAISSIADW